MGARRDYETNVVMTRSSMPVAGDVDVSVLIVSYNTKEWLRPCLESVRKAAQTVSHEVIVVDNASVDGSAEFVSEAFPQVRLLGNRENVGFARAVNQGARHAVGTYLLLLNPDGELGVGAVDALVAFSRANPQHIICGGRTVTKEGRLDPKSCWKAPDLWGLFCSATLLSTLFPGSPTFNPESMGGFARDRIQTVDIVSGCLLLISRADWNLLGGFDERYFVYGEDADLCLRATTRTGRTCAITPAAQMVHAVSASSASRAAKFELLLNGRIALVRTHMRGWRGRVGSFFIVAGVAVRAALETLGISSRATQWREVWKRREKWRRGYRTA